MTAERGPEQPITVDCWPGDDGFECHVIVGPPDDTTEHDVALSLHDLGRLAPKGTTAEALVKESFRFLLERERRESILRSFELTEIERYLPGYEAQIKSRL